MPCQHEALTGLDRVHTPMRCLQDIADNSVQVLAFVKFGAAFLAAAIAEWRAKDSTARKLHFSREQYILMTMIGLLDVFS